MRNLIILLALLLPTTVMHAGEAIAAESYRITLWATIDVDILGQPSRIEIDEADSYSPQLIGRLQQRLALAEFEPVVIGGQPRAFSTPVALELEVQPTADGGRVTLVEAKPTVRRVRNVSPYFPRTAIERGQGGLVLLRCDIGDDGRCRQITVEERSGPAALVRSATEALRLNEFDVPRVEGQPVDASVRVPYEFSFRRETEIDPREEAARQMEILAGQPLQFRRAIQGRL